MIWFTSPAARGPHSARWSHAVRAALQLLARRGCGCARAQRAFAAGAHAHSDAPRTPSPIPLISTIANSYDEANHKRRPPSEGVPPALMVQAGGRFFYATAARLMALKFILSMSVSAVAAAIVAVAVVVACSRLW